MKPRRLTRGQAIRAFCIECMGGDPRLPRECTVTGCALWIYRTGSEETIRDADEASGSLSRVDAGAARVHSAVGMDLSSRDFTAVDRGKNQITQHGTKQSIHRPWGSRSNIAETGAAFASLRAQGM